MGTSQSNEALKGRQTTGRGATPDRCGDGMWSDSTIPNGGVIEEREVSVTPTGLYIRDVSVYSLQGFRYRSTACL